MLTTLRTRDATVIVLALCLSIGFSGVAAAQGRSAVVTEIRIADRPSIDGRLDDACWAKGVWQGDLVVLGSDRPAGSPTRFCILHDEDNIYAAIECTEPDMDKLKEIRGGGIFRGDSIELFLDTDRDQETDYHLTTNTLGICEGKRAGREIIWRAAAHKSEGKWQSEIVIPFSSLQIGPDVGATWGFNLCRQRYAGKRELSTWSTLGPDGGFDQPKLFGELRGLHVDFARFRFEVGGPQVRTEIKGEALNVEFEVPLRNASGKAAELRLEGCLIPPEGKPQTEHVAISLAEGEETTVKLSGYAVDKSGDCKLLIALTDPTAGRVYYRARFGASLEYTPLGIRLLQPCYRAAIFATQSIDEIRLVVEAGLDEETLKTSSLELRLARAGSDEALETKRIAPLPGKEVQVGLDARGLEIGDYVITASLADEAGELVATTEHELHKLAAAPGSEVRLDKDFNTIIDGKPTFVYGYFSLTGCYSGRGWQGLEQTRADGCTALQNYNAHYWNDESGAAFLDAAKANDLGVVIYPFYRTFFREGGLPKIGDADTSLTDKMKEGITEAVNRWKDHPAMLAWLLSDEPDCNNWSPEALEELYQLVRRLDPYHPCIVLCRYANTHNSVRRCADIFMPDPYIHPRIDGRFDIPLTSFRDYFGAIRKTGKAPWVTPQAFSTAKNRSMMCEPGFEHLRAMAYMAIVHEAKGVLYYAWSYLTLFPGSYHGARFLSKEIAAIAPVLLEPDTGIRARIQPDDAEVEVLVREHKGDLYVIAVNTQFAEVDATFDLPGLDGRRLSVIFEDRKVDAEGSSFRDHFGKYEVHLYTTAAEPPNIGQTLGEVRAEVAGMQAARFKEGNLALRMTKDGALTGVTIAWKQGVYSIDGYTDLFTAYRWNARPQPPTDLTVTFPRAEAVGRVVVYTPNVRDYEVQTWDGENWNTVATVAGAAERVITSRFAPVETEKLRLHITGIQTPEWEREQYGFAASAAVVDEVEAYRE